MKKSRELKENQNKVCLYIATHNITGKKYFGKTVKYFTQEELQKYYHGSGKTWSNHLKKFGDDVTMEVYGIYNLDENDINYVKPIALKFSEDNNITESYEIWLNMKPEDGLEGGDNSSFLNYKQIGKKVSETLLDHIVTEETKLKMRQHIRSKEHCEKISKNNKGRKYDKDIYKTRKWNPANKGITGIFNHSDITKEKLKGKKEIVKCPHCGKEGGNAVMKRWHFDNCKEIKR